MSIGDRIRDLRWDRRLKQGELARRARIAQNTLSRIELGETTPSVPTLEKIARGLSMDVSDLLEEPALAGKSEAPDTGLVDTDEEITFQLESVDDVPAALHEVFSGYPPSQNKRLEMLVQDDGSVEVRIRPSESTKPTRQKVKKGGRVGTFTKKRSTKKRSTKKRART
jgi:transcriptional regulator with XRE-family HTH domain